MMSNRCSIEGIGPNEAGILSSIAFDAWLHVGYGAGEPRFFGMLRKRQLCDWLNYNSGFTLEEGTDTGGGHSKDGGSHWLKLQYAVPGALEVSGSFDAWGAPEEVKARCPKASTQRATRPQCEFEPLALAYKDSKGTAILVIQPDEAMRSHLLGVIRGKKG